MAQAGGLAAGGAVPIGRHHQIHARPALGHIPQLQGHGWLLVQGLQQHLHQGLVLQDPTHRGVRGARAGSGQIRAGEADLIARGPVTQLQAPKWGQVRQQCAPKAQLLQQHAAGMGQGVGTAAVGQGLGRQGVVQLHPPARLGQGQGGQGSRGAGPKHLGLRHRGRHRGTQQQSQKNRSTILCCGSGKCAAVMAELEISRCPADRG